MSAEPPGGDGAQTNSCSVSIANDVRGAEAPFSQHSCVYTGVANIAVLARGCDFPPHTLLADIAVLATLSIQSLNPNLQHHLLIRSCLPLEQKLLHCVVASTRCLPNGFTADMFGDLKSGLRNEGPVSSFPPVQRSQAVSALLLGISETC